MTLENSPSFEESGVQEIEKPKDGKLRILLLSGIVALLAIVLIGVILAQNGMLNFGSGSISGQAVNAAGDPIMVDVLVFGTNILVSSDATGNFVVDNVPAGDQQIIIAYGEIATEEHINVKRNTNNTLGIVTVPTDLLDLLD